MATSRLSFATVHVLCLLASACVLPEVSGASPSRAPRPSRPPPSRTSLGPARPSPDGPGVYRRFHANDSLIGRPVPCSRDEKICFRYNLVFDPQSDKCQPVGRGGDPAACDTRVDKEEFEHGSGHVRGFCAPFEDPCPGHRMAFDGRCYRKRTVRDVICGCDAQPTPHFLGGVECRCSAAALVRVEQPDGDGRCLVPDLRFPDVQRFAFVEDRFSPLSADAPFGCVSEQNRRCFSEGKVWMSEGNDCYRLLERGPCPEDHVVVLKGHAVLEGRAEAVCVHARGGCPPGEKLMLYDGRCHDDRELAIAIPGNIFQNPAGEYGALKRAVGLTYTLKLVETRCVLSVRPIPLPPANTSRPTLICASNDTMQRSLCEVQEEPPAPQ